MTYSKHEAPVLIPIEYELMDQLGLDRSELHHIALKEFWNRRQQSTLKMIWGLEMKQPKPLRPIYLAMLEEARLKHKDRTIDESLINAIEDYFKKKK